MSDLPERIFVESRPKVFSRDKDGNMRAEEVEYLRADLAPAVGYSREQVEDALCFGVRYGFKQTNFEPETTDEAWSEFEATLTPAAQPVVGYSRSDVVGAMEDLGMWVHDSVSSWNDISVQIEKIVATLTPTHAAEAPIPTVDFFEVAGEWSVKEGFTTWYKEHEAVVRNFCRYLTKGQGGA
jgi:hypothetical protein